MASNYVKLSVPIDTVCSGDKKGIPPAKIQLQPSYEVSLK